MRRWLGGLVFCGALLFAAPGAQAAVYFGSDLTQLPLSSTNCGSAPDGCSLFNSAVHTGNAYSLTSPMTGVVTGITMKKHVADPGTWQTIQVHAVQRLAPTSWTRSMASTSIHPSDTGGLQAFNVRFPINVGDYVGLSGSGIIYPLGPATGATMETTYPNPLNPNGSPGSSGNVPNIELLVRARVEPDADHDGFGDETQDACPSNFSVQGTCPLPAAVPTTVNQTVNKKKCHKHKRRAAEAKKKCKKRKHR
jgi:hypothetical protein